MLMIRHAAPGLSAGQSRSLCCILQRSCRLACLERSDEQTRPTSVSVLLPSDVDARGLRYVSRGDIRSGRVSHLFSAIDKPLLRWRNAFLLLQFLFDTCDLRIKTCKHRDDLVQSHSRTATYCVPLINIDLNLLEKAQQYIQLTPPTICTRAQPSRYARPHLSARERLPQEYVCLHQQGQQSG